MEGSNFGTAGGDPGGDYLLHLSAAQPGADNSNDNIIIITQ